MEYIHEEVYDKESNCKWTIFNKHAIEIDGQDKELEKHLKEQEEEDQIVQKMILEDKISSQANVCTLPQRVWLNLYEAKCRDLGIQCKYDK